MRVRTRRFRPGNQGRTPIARYGPKAASLRPHASHPGLPASRSPIRRTRRRLQPGGRVSAHRFSPSRVSRLPVSSFTRAFHTPPARYPANMASADFPKHFLLGISPDKNLMLPGAAAAFTYVSESVGFAVLCQLATPRRPCMRFLFVSPPVSSSLPPPGRLPSRSWPPVVVSHVTMPILPQGTCTPFASSPCWAYTTP